MAIEEIETNPDISDEIEIVVPPPHSGRGRVESQRKTIKSITVKSPAGDVCEIHYDHDRPEIFKVYFILAIFYAYNILKFILMQLFYQP